MSKKVIYFLFIILFTAYVLFVPKKVLAATNSKNTNNSQIKNALSLITNNTTNLKQSSNLGASTDTEENTDSSTVASTETQTNLPTSTNKTTIPTESQGADSSSEDFDELLDDENDNLPDDEDPELEDEGDGTLEDGETDDSDFNITDEDDEEDTPYTSFNDGQSTSTGSIPHTGVFTNVIILMIFILLINTYVAFVNIKKYRKL